MKPTDIKKLLQKLAMTDDQDISCDDCLEVLDQFAEMRSRGEDVSGLMPLVQKHLEICPDCKEEYDALMKALNFEKNN